MELEKKASNQEPPIEHAAADIFAEHGLEFVALEERFLSLALVSKDLHRRCGNQLEAEFWPRLPSLVESIARSSSSRGKRFTYGRVKRFMHTPTMELGMKWPSLKRSDLDEIDVLIQIEDLRKMHENRFSKNLGYAVGRLHHDSATRDLYCNAQCDHFDFQIPHYKPQEQLGSADKSDHLMSLKDAFAKNRCLKCAHCNSHSQPCLRPSLTLAARVVFRHSNSGRMAHILFDTLPLASGENGNDPVGSYSILFQTTLNFTFFGTVSANLEFRLFSEERKDINSFTVSTRPFPNSPESDPQIPGLPSYCQVGRSDKFSRLSFRMWTKEREEENSSPGDADPFVRRIPPTKSLLLALRNFLWG